jgi:hypothetical protein
VTNWYGVRYPGESASSFATRRRQAQRTAIHAAWLETLPGVKTSDPARSTAAEMFARARPEIAVSPRRGKVSGR